MWAVLVVDDRRRFPSQVWRYLTRSCGFQFDPGTATDGENGSTPESDAGHDPPDAENGLPTYDGQGIVWWVQANDRSADRVIEIVQSLGEPRRLTILVDIFASSERNYDASKTRHRLLSELPGEPNCEGKPELLVVSAYSPSSGLKFLGDPVPIRPKTRDTLRAVREKTVEAGRHIVEHAHIDAPPGARHVLVTGAGFEMRNELDDVGLPSTASVLSSMGSPFYPDGESHSEKINALPLRPGIGFPIPAGGSWDTAGGIIKDIAESQDLDRWWDALLMNIPTISLPFTGTPAERDKAKSGIYQREVQLREAFRKAILKYDWGYLNQAICAARLGFDGWLSTNYTRFADRAIDLVGDSSPPREGPPWTVVSTPAEATRSQRDIVAATGTSLERNASDQPRYLFKLHGDISHVQTMAIAREDKELFSILTVPIDSLHMLYASAERVITKQLDGDEPVIWHVVGHGLRDRKLLELLQAVVGATRCEHTFRLSNLRPDEPEAQMREFGLRQGARVTIDPRPGGAVTYMAQLEREWMATRRAG